MESQKTSERPTRRKKKTNWLPFIAVGILLYTALQIYLMNTNSVDTVKAVEGYINDSIIAPAVVCRDEQILTGNIQGSLDYQVSDGQRVSKGRLIADVYPSYSDVVNVEKLRDKQKALDDINSAASYLEGSVLDMSLTKKQLDNQLARLSLISSENAYKEVYDSLTDITLSINKISVATGKTTDFSAAQQQIQSEISSLQSLIPAKLDSLTSPYTGYFLSASDGWEGVATVDNFLSLSYEDGIALINSAPAAQPARGEYGKIITDYKWSVCTYVDSTQAEQLYEGKSISVSLSVPDNNFQKATITNVVDLGEKTLVVAECSMMDFTSATVRITDCELLFKQYKGIKIPNTAIRFEDGNMGVYVNFSNIVQFKKISPIYEDENYVIIPTTQSSDNQVKLYDSIIVKGRNLYDGKYL